jgi:hypothetical protein
LKEKCTLDFSKRRQIRQEADELVSEAQNETKYYQNKYKELKLLLNDCRDQLKQFEELNEARNAVIEKLEVDN